MPTYSLLFTVEPTGPFGLPEAGKTIVPAGGETYSPSIDTLTGNLVGHGTLPIYRVTPLEKDGVSGATGVGFKDNYLTITLDADTDGQAVETGIERANRLCALMSVIGGRYFSVQIVQAVNETERRSVPLPRHLSLLAVTTYNLDHLSAHLEAAIGALILSDDLLDKANAYLYHALYMERELETVNPFSFHRKLIVSEFILNCHKAVSTILGEPHTDPDYSSRYQRYGVSADLWRDVGELRRLRNAYDVAHYSPDWQRLDEVQQHVGLAKQTAQEVIKTYIAWSLSRTP